MRQFTCPKAIPVPIPVITGLDVEQLRWSRPTRYRYTKPPTYNSSLYKNHSKFT